MSTPTARPTAAARPRSGTGRAAGIVFAVLLGILSMLALSPGGMPSFSLGEDVVAVAQDHGSGGAAPTQDQGVRR